MSCVICHDNNRKLRFFHVPKNSARLQRWSKLLNGLKIKPSAIICEKHFIQEHLTRNVQKNCWRLNSKAIPMLHSKLKKELINEDVFDTSSAVEYIQVQKQFFKNTAAQTNIDDAKTCAFVTVTDNFMVYNVNCFYCDASFSIRDWDKFMRHVECKHRCKEQSFFEAETMDDLIAKKRVADDDMDNHILELEASCKKQKLAENSIGDENEVHVITWNTFLSSNEKNVDEKISHNETEDNNSNDKLQLPSYAGIGEEEHSDVSPETDDDEPPINEILISDNKMLPFGTTSKNALNIETSDSSFVFFIIDSLQSIPTLWLADVFKTKEYISGLDNLCQVFAENYPHYMTSMELYESVDNIRFWYQKIFEEKSYERLSYPQSEYYRKCSEFLADKSDGKTCEACQITYPDHLQYFAHQQLEKHQRQQQQLSENDSLAFLKKHASDYLSARYPRVQHPFSFQCQVCPTNNTIKYRFFEHLKAHLNIREYMCDFCGKFYIKLITFQIHQRRHTGPIKRNCLICEKSFNDVTLLKGHRMRYHKAIEGTIEEIEASIKKCRPGTKTTRYVICPKTNRKYYPCQYCEKKYTSYPAFNKHNRLTHGDKRFEEVNKKKVK